MISIEQTNNLKHIKLLVVEDNESLANSIRSILQSFCQQVDTVDNAEIGVERFCEIHHDCIITDIHLPKRNGIWLCEQISQVDDSVPIIVMTAYDSLETRQHVINTHTHTYLRKPFELDDLIMTILLCIRKKSTPHKITENMSLDPTKQGIILDQEFIKLSKTEYDILYLLLINRNEIISTERLLYAIWSDRTVKENTLRMHIKNIRKKIGPEWILNVPTVGYYIPSFNAQQPTSFQGED